MKIVIETIPHADQRYPTVGDWWIHPDGSWQIRVSELPTKRAMFPEKFAFLVALHELVEMAACQAAGVDEDRVTEFDVNFEAEGREGEPGDAEDSPYREQHSFATMIEMIMAERLGVDWDEYDKAVEALP